MDERTNVVSCLCLPFAIYTNQHGKKTEKVEMQKSKRKWSFTDITLDIILWFPNFNLNSNSITIFFDFFLPFFLFRTPRFFHPHNILLESCEFLIINFFSISVTIYIHSTYLYSGTELSYQWKLMLPYQFTFYNMFMLYARHVRCRVRGMVNWFSFKFLLTLYSFFFKLG